MALDVSSPPEAHTHLQTLTVLSLLVRVLVALLIVSSTHSLTLFDSSPRLVLDSSVPTWISSLLRWDAFHFAHVAQKGHTYEHTWAFFPAVPFIMRWSGHLLSRVGLNSSDTAAQLLGGAVLAAIFDPTRVLYRLSLHHLGSPSAAFLATALSLLSSSPATLRYGPYSEPFFTYCSYQGMWACAHSQWFRASIWFALASAFRSNGVFLSGFILWGMLVVPYLSLSARKDLLTPSRVLYCIVLVAIPLVPFVHHNYAGYVRFCTTPNRPGWCDQSWFPSLHIYAHVQRAYWNVGFLRYWIVSNVPNFILALPILLNVYTFSWVYLSRLPRIYPRLFLSPGTKRAREAEMETKTVPFFAPSILPHVLHALAITLLLTFNAHVQIALRVVPSMPMVYWGAAWLVVERPWWGRAWVMWSVGWGGVSCVLWAVFLPPA